MQNTEQLRDKMLQVWRKVDSGEMTAQEARIHIGVARTVLDSLKVEIAAAHLNMGKIPPISLGPKLRVIGSNKKRAA